jgi:hypothetical protein
MRIAEIGAMVAKIWQKEFQGLICNFMKVARAKSRNIFGFQRFCLEKILVGCRINMDKDRGLFVIIAEIF